MENLPDKTPGILHLLGGILDTNEIPKVCYMADGIAEHTATMLRSNGFQLVGNAQLVPSGADGESLAVRLVCHYVGEVEATRSPTVWPGQLPDGMVLEGLDARILRHLENCIKDGEKR